MNIVETAKQIIDETSFELGGHIWHVRGGYATTDVGGVGMVSAGPERGDDAYEWEWIILADNCNIVAGGVCATEELARLCGLAAAMQLRSRPAV